MKKVFFDFQMYITCHFFPFQCIHMDWTGQHCAFIVEAFIKNESVTGIQRTFRVHFENDRHDTVPTRNTILLSVTNF